MNPCIQTLPTPTFHPLSFHPIQFQRPLYHNDSQHIYFSFKRQRKVQQRKVQPNESSYFSYDLFLRFPLKLYATPKKKFLPGNGI
jgi:hypothetical protein